MNTMLAPDMRPENSQADAADVGEREDQAVAVVVGERRALSAMRVGRRGDGVSVCLAPFGSAVVPDV